MKDVWVIGIAPDRVSIALMLNVLMLAFPILHVIPATRCQSCVVRCVIFRASCAVMRRSVSINLIRSVTGPGRQMKMEIRRKCAGP